MKNTRYCLLTLFCLTVLLFYSNLSAQFAGGSGTEADPYLIKTAEDLANINNYSLQNKSFKLIQHIDLKSYISNAGSSGWQPLTLKGNFDGNNLTISGLMINRGFASNIGLFGFVYDNSQIKNLNVRIAQDSSVRGGSCVGGLAGKIGKKVIITNCSVVGKVSGLENTGGLIGQAGEDITDSLIFDFSNAPRIVNCRTAGWVGATLSSGGLIGLCRQATVEKCTSSSTVVGMGGGGLIGLSELSLVVNCGAFGSAFKGGLIGRLGHSGYNGGVVNGCFATGSVAGSVGGAGGLIGSEEYTDPLELISPINHATAPDNLGSAINFRWKAQKYSDSYSLKIYKRTPNDHLIQENIVTGSETRIEINNVLHTGVINPYYWTLTGRRNGNTGLTSAPGYFGFAFSKGEPTDLNNQQNLFNYSTDVKEKNSLNAITDCYSAGSVSGEDFSGGLIGKKIPSNVTYCYWDVTRSGQNSSAAGIGKTSAEIKNLSLYNPSLQNYFRINPAINNGYPYFYWQESFFTKPAAPVISSNASSYSGFSLNWSAIQNAEEYYLDIATDPAFNSILPAYNNFRCPTLTPSYNTVDLKSGQTYYCRLRTSSIGGVSLNSNILTVKTLSFAAGSGTLTDPYQITNAIELSNIRNFTGNFSGTYFKLMNDIDLSDYLSASGAGYNGGALWLPIGDSPANSFQGNFNGNNHVIRNLKINRPTTDNVGLFGYCAQANISNLQIETANEGINGKDNVAVLCGFFTYNSKLSKSCTKGRVSGNANVGGLVGYNDYAEYENSYSQAAVSGVNSVGGLVGYANSGSFINCYSTGLVAGSGSNSGGLAGRANSIMGSDNFWDKESTNQQNSAIGSGKTTAEMKSQGTFTNWNFTTTWQISPALNNGYPDLAALPSPVALAASEITTTAFYANWGTVPGSTTYFLDLATDINFTNFVYANLNAGNVTSLNISGLTLGNTYYYRVRASGTAGVSGNSNIITVRPAYFSQGSGTAENPYWVTTAIELNNLRYFTGTEFSNIYFKLMNNIDLTTYLSISGAGYNSGAFWQPIGTESSRFCGKVDGNHQTIKGLKINRPAESFVGLFGYCGNAEIKNLGIETGTDYIVGLDNVGGVAGRSLATITSCYFNGNISGHTWYGGIVGWNDGSVTSSFSQGSVNSTGNSAGGLVGQNEGLISHCYSSAITRGENYVGGLAGHQMLGMIEHSYAAGAVTNTGNPLNKGGILGANLSGGTVVNCYWDKETTGMSTSYGSADSFGKNTAEMKMSATYSNWNVGIWHHNTENNSYPHLSWQLFAPLTASAMNIKPNGFTASWQATDHATSYLVDLAEHGNFYSFSTTEVVGTNRLVFTNLTPLKAYYFRVRSKNSLRISYYTAVVTVRTDYFSAGSGTAADPYQVRTAEELNRVRNYPTNSEICFKLMNNIDLSDYLSPTGDGYNNGQFWQPIGKTYNQEFAGKFDGNNFKITNLKINLPQADTDGWLAVGLFGYCQSAQIKNLGVETSESGIVSNVVTGILAGNAYEGIITNCYVNGKIQNISSYSGGLVGSCGNSTISNSYSNGSVTGTDNVGGLVGVINKTPSATETPAISNCYSTVSVQGSNNVGGLVGDCSFSAINNSFATGSVTCTSGGGLIGYVANNSGDFSTNYWNSTINSSADLNNGFGNPKSTAQMQSQATYNGWNFTSLWKIAPTVNSGYPFFGIAGSTALAATNIGTTGFTANWSSVVNASGYYLDLATDEAFTQMVSGYSNIDAGKTTSLSITGLTPDITYYYRVRSYNSISETDNSNTVSTKTLTVFANGNGSVQTPYQITTAEELNSLRYYLGVVHANKHFQLMNNLDLNNYLYPNGAGNNGNALWQPVGNLSNPFYGTLDGNGKIISNLQINRYTENAVGLFGYLNGSVKNLGLENAFVYGSTWNGSLVGWNNGNISGCYSSGQVMGQVNTVGGLVGQNEGVISDCYSHAKTSGVDYVGGLVGHQQAGAIQNSYATGMIVNSGSPANKGGILGGNYGSGSVTNCYWDRETTGVSTSFSISASYGKTTVEMQKQATFSGWDFTGTWKISEDYYYPVHQWLSNQFLAGKYTVGTGGDFTSLTAAEGLFAAINSGTVIGNITAKITSDLSENGSITLNQCTGGFSLTIQPDATVPRTISGSAGENSALICLNGADNVTIDGTINKLLTIANIQTKSLLAGNTKNRRMLEKNSPISVISIDNNSRNCTIKNCIITNSSNAASSVYGIKIGDAPNSEISKNRICNLNGSGDVNLTGIAFTGAATAVSAKIANNMISLIPTTTGIVSGISYSGNVQNSLDLYYNSIYIGGTQSGNNHSYGFLKSSVAANLNIKNNIFHNARTNSTGTGKHYAVALVNTVGTVTEDYNLLYSASNFAGLYGSADKSTLTSWISDTPYDDNSKSSVIQFENEAAGNLAFKRAAANSAVFNTGVTVSGITEDFFGKARPQYSTEDMGAHELEQSSGLEENTLPVETRLAQNYPNPFNPITAINYELRVADNVKLAVFNAKGEMVKTLVNGMQNAGRYSVNFDGGGVNSGVYFYKLEADGKSMVKRMLMVK